ncbi:protein of unknown function (plasmid) [Cupriavidus taiwanensis]|nr:protein of unknown function [Cupriavidus taiwanensis]SPA03380.1 protein of unknown function [Cupriavidus taiwanensis]SPA11393.1 protein of unknown function [Cupriavidus taiwanensis]
MKVLRISLIAELATDVAALKLPVVLDHFAGGQGTQEEKQKGAFVTAVELGFDDVTEDPQPLYRSRNRPPSFTNDHQDTIWVPYSSGRPTAQL